MIRLECSNCQTVLNIDDAFAGGVCRCQYCGTIQTVPRPGEPTSDSEPPTQKALFKRKARIESALSPYNDQLAKAADEMDSSGHFSASSVGNVGGGSSIASKQTTARAVAGRPSATAVATNTANASPARTPSRGGFVLKPSASAAPVTPSAPSAGAGRRTMVIVAASIALASVVGVGAWLLLGRSNPVKLDEDTSQTLPSTNPVTPATNAPTGAEPPVIIPAIGAGMGSIASSPAICDIALQGSTIVYVLDRSGCTQETFQRMANACVKSCESLSASRSFQVIVWNGHQEVLIPAAGPGPAIASNIEACRTALADTYSGISDISAIMAKAMAGKPNEIVIMSSVDLDEITATEIRKVIEGKTVILHGIAVGNDLVGDQLRLLATNTQGKFQRVDIATLP